MFRVDFIIAGAQKCGTSAIFHFLSQHPEISLTHKDEIHFFDTDQYFEASDVDYDTYHEFFNSNENDKLFGEKTPMYLFWKESCARIFRYNPKMKFIFSLRNPIFRAFSHWKMETERTNEHLSFSEAIRNESSRVSKSELSFRSYTYCSRGLYAEQVKQYLQFFKRDQLLFIRQEDLLSQHEKTLETICDFLNVERHIPHQEIIFSTQPSRMSREDYQYLMYFFKEDISELEEILGWDCTGWKTESDRREAPLFSIG
jgi:hypothetical protein